VKWNLTFGLRCSQARTSGVVGGQVVQHDVDLFAAVRTDGLAQEAREVLAAAAG
jgi:hypothetical protein